MQKKKKTKKEPKKSIVRRWERRVVLGASSNIYKIVTHTQINTKWKQQLMRPNHTIEKMRQKQTTKNRSPMVFYPDSSDLIFMSHRKVALVLSYIFLVNFRRWELVLCTYFVPWFSVSVSFSWFKIDFFLFFCIGLLRENWCTRWTVEC